jgi:hypothetical protein
MAKIPAINDQSKAELIKLVLDLQAEMARLRNEVKQQKCVAHILKNLKQMLERPVRGRSQAFPKALRRVFKDALKIHSSFKTKTITRVEFNKIGNRIFRRLDRLLELGGL